MKHRSETEIIALILESINNNGIRATQTRIMYEAYLSYAQLKGHLPALLEKGLIDYHKEDRFYTITEKGMHFIQIYNQIDLLQTSNFFKATKEYENVEGSTQIVDYENSGRSGYLAVSEQLARTSRWKCEKCQRSLANLKELKVHKVEYHSY
jgi:predicted transcriptional regulator